MCAVVTATHVSLRGSCTTLAGDRAQLETLPSALQVPLILDSASRHRWSAITSHAPKGAEADRETVCLSLPLPLVQHPFPLPPPFGTHSQHAAQPSPFWATHPIPSAAHRTLRCRAHRRVHGARVPWDGEQIGATPLEALGPPWHVTQSPATPPFLPSTRQRHTAREAGASRQFAQLPSSRSPLLPLHAGATIPIGKPHHFLSVRRKGTQTPDSFTQTARNRTGS
jgi:hypothetical protein